MLGLDDWYDWWRALNILLCLSSLVTLQRRFVQSNKYWNTKTRDCWFALVMWCVAGIDFSIESIVENQPFGSKIVFLCVASTVTWKGVLNRGSWGGPGDNRRK